MRSTVFCDHAPPHGGSMPCSVSAAAMAREDWPAIDTSTGRKASSRAAASAAYCISQTVFNHARDKVTFDVEEAGEQILKNIARPVHVYRIVIDPGRQTAMPKSEVPALALPDKPSVAVLPLTNMSGDSEQEFVSDGIAEDVITALSRYPSLFVIARNSSFTYKGRAVDVRQVGRELGVRYVLEGSVRKAGNRIRVTAQLIEAATSNHVWAERYDRDLADVFAVQDELTEALTTALAPAIADAELRRAMRKPPGSLDAWAAYQRGLWHLGKATADDDETAEKFSDRQSISTRPSAAATARSPCTSCKRPRSTRR